MGGILGKHLALLLPRRYRAVRLGLLGDVARSVVAEPFDGPRQAIDLAEARLDGRDHEIAHIFPFYALSRGDPGDRFAVAAVEGEGDRTFSPLSQASSKPSEHQRRFEYETAILPSWRRASAPPA